MWPCAFGLREFNLSAEVVLGVPNDGSAPLLNNVDGAIVVLERGRVPFATKVRAVQEAGGLAAIIADDGACNEEFQCTGSTGSRPPPAHQPGGHHDHHQANVAAMQLDARGQPVTRAGAGPAPVFASGFAASDDPSAWSAIRIPAALITQGSYQRLRRLMTTTLTCDSFQLEGHGTQHYCEAE